MTAKGWKRVAFALGFCCVLLAWCSRGGGHAGAARGGDHRRADRPRAGRRTGAGWSRPGGERDRPELSGDRESPATTAASDGFPGDTPPGDEPPPPPKAHWLWRFFRPRPDETPLDYRDRVLPVVQAAVAPQRNRVARNRADFIAEAELDDGQVAELDAAVDQAAENITSRVFDGVFSGELMPPNIRPIDGVAFARDLLDEVVPRRRAGARRPRGAPAPADAGNQLSALDFNDGFLDDPLCAEGLDGCLAEL